MAEPIEPNEAEKEIAGKICGECRDRIAVRCAGCIAEMLARYRQRILAEIGDAVARASVLAGTAREGQQDAVQKEGK